MRNEGKKNLPSFLITRYASLFTVIAFPWAYAQRLPLGAVGAKAVHAAAAVVQLVEAFGLDEEGIVFEQAEDAFLAWLGPLGLAGLAGLGIVRLVMDRLFVGGDVAFVIAQDDFVVRGADHIAGLDGDLAAAAGRVDHVGGDGIT